MKITELPIKGYPFLIIAENTDNDDRVVIIVDRPSNSAYWSWFPKDFSLGSSWSKFDFKELPEGWQGRYQIPEIDDQSLTFEEWLKEINHY